MSEAKWERRDCVSAEVEQSVVLLDLDTLLYHSLNRTASAIWEMLSEPRSAEEITEGLCTQYRVNPEECRSSVERTLRRFQEAGLAAPKAAA